MDLTHRYLIFGAPRAQLADALLEYRRFAIEHPEDPLAAELLDVARQVRLGLREERQIRRALGHAEKVNSEHKLPASERRKMQAARRRRLVPTPDPTTERSTMSTTLATRTTEYSCRPFAPLALDGHADAMNKILDALEADPRAIGPVLDYDDATEQVGAIFQVEFPEVYDRGEDARSVAAKLAGDIFDAALHVAGLEQRTVGLAIVEGDDPELLP